MGLHSQLPLSGYISARLDLEELPIFQLSKVNYNPSAAVVQMVVRYRQVPHWPGHARRARDMRGRCPLLHY
jgi:hypothetical protein